MSLLRPLGIVRAVPFPVHPAGDLPGAAAIAARPGTRAVTA